MIQRFSQNRRLFSGSQVRFRASLAKIACCLMLSGSGVLTAQAETIKAIFDSPADIPIQSVGYNGVGKKLAITLNFEPEVGAELTVIRNQKSDFIEGYFDNLSQGERIELEHNGSKYPFVVDYYGGVFGRDLVLKWATNRLFAWGKRDMLGGFASRDAPTAVWTRNTPLDAGKTILKVATGLSHSLALLSDGTLVAWGANGDGQLGNNSEEHSFFPVKVSDTLKEGSYYLQGRRVVDIAAGVHHSLALCSDGTVLAWGRNTHGQLGSAVPKGVVQRVPVVAVNMVDGSALAGRKVVAIAAGAYHSMGLAADGTLAAWGKNDSGQLGDGTTEDRLKATLVSRNPQESTLTGRTVIRIAAGTGHSIALTADGSMHSWGSNESGQLGQVNPVTNSTSTNTFITGGSTEWMNNSTVRQIDGPIDTYNSIIDNPYFGLASEAFGIEFPPILSPQAIGDMYGLFSGNPLREVTVIETTTTTVNWRESPGFILVSQDLYGKFPIDVRAGWKHTLVLFADGTVASWGDNAHGQLGSGTLRDRRSPAAVSAEAGLSALHGKTPLALGSGRGFSSVVLSDGTVAMWGGNEYGEIGDRTTEDRLYPTAVDASALAARERFVGISGTADALHTVAIVASPLVTEMKVYGNGREIRNGSSYGRTWDLTAFGRTAADAPVVHTFQIRSSGVGSLQLSGEPRVAISGPAAGDFTVTRQPAATVPGSGGLTTFDVSFLPLGSGRREATVTLLNNADGEGPFTFSVSGIGPYSEIRVSGNGTSINRGSNVVSSVNHTNFGTSLPDAPVVRTFTITNPGSGYLNLTGAETIAVSGPHAADFTVTQLPSSRVANAGGTTDFEISFFATGPGSRSAVVTIENDTRRDDPFFFRIEGKGSEPLIRLLGGERNIADGESAVRVADYTDFGATSVGILRTHTFTIRNDGNGTLRLSGTPTVALSGSGKGDFFVSVEPDPTVAHKGGTTTFDITFAPSSVGQSSEATVSIESDAATASPYTFKVRGYGAKPEIVVVGSDGPIANGSTQPTLQAGTDFGSSPTDVAVGRLFTVKNNGLGRLNLLGRPAVTLSGPGASDFAVTTDPSSPIAAGGGSTTFGITYTPAASGTVSEATVSIASDDPDASLYTFAIRGSGPFPLMQIRGNQVAIEPGSVIIGSASGTDFGTSAVGEPVTQAFVVHNEGRADLNLTGTPAVALSGPGAADFAVDSQAVGPIAPGASSTFTIRYTPTEIGKLSEATVTLSSDDTVRTPYRFAIRGAGPAPVIRIKGNEVLIPAGASAGDLVDGTDFGSVSAEFSVTRVFIILNEGLTDLNLTGTPKVEITGTDAADFSLITAPTSPVAFGGGTTMFALAFTPTVPGKTSVAEIRVASDDGERSLYTFTVRGYAPTSTLQVFGNGEELINGSNPITLSNHTDFGGTSVGGTLERTFTLQNSGEGHLRLNGTPRVALSGTHSGDFSVYQLPSSVVGPSGGNTSLVIRYMPMEVGRVSTATVALVSDDPDNSLFVFEIRGTSLAPDMQVQGNGEGISNGATTGNFLDGTYFGSVALAESVSRTFTILNGGPGNLRLTGMPRVAISGAAAGDFILTQDATTPVVAEGSTAFQVTFIPSENGLRSATVTIANDDPAGSPYTFALQGQGPNPEYTLYEHGPSTMIDLREIFDDPSGSLAYSITGNTQPILAQSHIRDSFLIITPSDLSSTPSTTLTIAATDGGTPVEIPFVFNLIQVNSEPQAYFAYDASELPATIAAGGSAQWFDVAASRDGQVLVAGRFGTLRVSSDGGESWADRVTDKSRLWATVAASADGKDLVAGENTDRALHVSHDYGATWTVRFQPGGMTWTHVDMTPDGATMIAVSGNWRTSDVYLSTDNGSTWNSVLTIDGAFSTVGISADGGTIVAAQNSGPKSSTLNTGGVVYVSQDGGQSWVTRLTDVYRQWSSVDCSDDGTRWVAAVRNEHIYTSDDSGLNWTRHAVFQNEQWVNVLCSADGMTMFATTIGRAANLAVSVDGGETWQRRFDRFSTNVGMTSVAFLENEAYVLGGHSGVGAGLRVFPTLSGIPVVRATMGEFSNTHGFLQVNQGHNDSGGTVTSSVTNDNPSLFTDQPTLSNVGRLSFMAAPDAIGIATIRFYAQDDQGTANGGKDTSPSKEFIIEVSPRENSAPSASFASQMVEVNQGSGSYAAGEGFATFYAGSPSDSWQNLRQYIVSVDVPGLFDVLPMIDNDGTLTFTAAGDTRGETKVTVTVLDDGGLEFGGTDTGTATFTIAVRAINSAPSVEFASRLVTTAESAPEQHLRAFAAFSPGPVADDWQKLAGYTLTTDNPDLFATGPEIDFNGTLIFTPTFGAVGLAVVSVEVRDNGGTFGGGVDASINKFAIEVKAATDLSIVTTSADSGSGSLRNALLYANEAENPVTILFLNNLGVIAPDSALPVITNKVTFLGGHGNDLDGTIAVGAGGALDLALSKLPGGDVVLQNGGRLIGDGDIQGSLTVGSGGILSLGNGNGSESGVLGADSIHWSGGGGFDWSLSDANGASGQTTDLLVFRDALHLEASATGSFPFTIRLVSIDAGGNPGPLANFDPDQGKLWTLAKGLAVDTSGGASTQQRLVGFRYLDGLVIDASGFTDFNDTRGGRFSLSLQGDAVRLRYTPNLAPVAADDSYTLAQGGTLSVTAAVGVLNNDYDPLLDPISAQLVSNAGSGTVVLNGDGSFTYEPASTEFTGSDTFTYQVDDGSRISSVATVTIHVLPANQAPTFSLRGSVNVLEDCGPQSVVDFAFAINPGSILEAGQVVNFALSVDNEALFQEAPTLDEEGTLTFTPAANANGAAVVTVVAQDSGPTDNGGENTSVPQTFDLVVTAVNDAPSISFEGDPLLVATTASGFSLEAFATFSPGPSDEAGQSLVGYSVTADQPALFSTQPQIDNNGDLTFTPASSMTAGTTVVTVVAQDSGGTSNGGVDTSTQTFVLSLVEAGSTPSFSLNADRFASVGLVWTPRDGIRNWDAVTASSDGSTMAAVESNGSIHVSKDGGVTWSATGPNKNWTSIASSSDGSVLIAAADADSLYVSTDGGVSWAARESARSWQAVASSADGLRLAAAARNGSLHLSTDGGETWKTSSHTASSWSRIASSADGLQWIAAGGVSDRVKVSRDGGTIWEPVLDLPNAAWVDVSWSRDGETLVFAAAGLPLMISTDRGFSWMERESSRAWAGVTMSDDGQRIAAIVEEGLVYLSRDRGVHWTPVSGASDDAGLTRSWSGIAFSASGERLLASVDGGTLFTSGGPQLVEDEGRSGVLIRGLVEGLTGGPAGADVLPAVNLSVSSDQPTFFTGSPTITAAGDLSYTLAPAATGEVVLTVTAQYADGTVGDAFSQNIPLLIRSVPTVANLSSVPTSGTFGNNSSLALKIEFDEPVVVSGTPYLALNSGGIATYSGGSGSTVLSFGYTVGAGQSTSLLDSIAANALVVDGASICGIAGVEADLTLPVGDEPGSLALESGLVVDSVRPQVLIGAPSKSVTVAGPVTYSISLVDENLIAVDLVSHHMYLDSDGTANGSISVIGSFPEYTATISDITGIGRIRLVVDFGVAIDAANNLSLRATSESFAVNAAVTNITSTSADGTYAGGDHLSLQVRFTGSVYVIGKPRLALNSGGFAQYASGSGTDTLQFDYVPEASDAAARLDVASVNALFLNGGIIETPGGIGANLSLPTPGGLDSLGGQKAIVIDTSMLNAGSQIVATSENESVAITLTGSDPGGAPLMYHIVNGPSNGSLSGTAPNLTYTPGTGYYGMDAFTFTVSNGTETSEPGTVSILVTNIYFPSTQIALSENKIPDGLSAYTTVGILSRLDVDPSDTFNYQLVFGEGDSDNFHFLIFDNGSSAQLLITEGASYDRQSSYTIRVRSTDQATNASVEQAFLLEVLPPPTVTTLAASGVRDTQASFNASVDPRGNVVEVRYEYSTGSAGEWTVVTLAGTGDSGYSDGKLDVARFNQPSGVTVDASGNVYVADAGNHAIRMIGTDGTVTTLAGSGVAGFADAAGTAAQFHGPVSLAFLSGDGGPGLASEPLLVVDQLNHRIRLLSSDGEVTTFAGSGQAGLTDGDAATAEFNHPSSISLDYESIFVADRDNHAVRTISFGRSGVSVSTFAGDGTAGYVQGDGLVQPQFRSPEGIITLFGSALVSDSGNHLLRFLGQGAYPPATGALVSDSGNHPLRFLVQGASPPATMPVAGNGMAGLGDGYPGQLNQPAGMAFHSEMFSVLIADRGNHSIRMSHVEGGDLTTLAGNGTIGYVDGPLSTAQFNEPNDVAYDSANNRILIADRGNHAIRSIQGPAGPIEVIAARNLTGEGARMVNFSVTGLEPETTYFVRALAYYGDGSVVAGDSVSFTTLEAGASLSGYFGFIDDLGLTGDDAAFDADPVGRGMSNGQLYATGGYSYAVVEEVASTPRFVFVLRQGADDVAVKVQWSSDLIEWQNLTSALEVETEVDRPQVGFDRVTYGLPDTLANEPKQFFRLKLTKQ